MMMYAGGSPYFNESDYGSAGGNMAQGGMQGGAQFSRPLPRFGGGGYGYGGMPQRGGYGGGGMGREPQFGGGYGSGMGSMGGGQMGGAGGNMSPGGYQNFQGGGGNGGLSPLATALRSYGSRMYGGGGMSRAPQFGGGAMTQPGQMGAPGGNMAGGSLPPTYIGAGPGGAGGGGQMGAPGGNMYGQPGGPGAAPPGTTPGTPGADAYMDRFKSLVGNQDPASQAQALKFMQINPQWAQDNQLAIRNGAFGQDPNAYNNFINSGEQNADVKNSLLGINSVDAINGIQGGLAMRPMGSNAMQSAYQPHGLDLMARGQNGTF